MSAWRIPTRRANSRSADTPLLPSAKCLHGNNTRRLVAARCPDAWPLSWTACTQNACAHSAFRAAVGIPNFAAAFSVSSAASGHVCMMSICPSSFSIRRDNDIVMQRQRPHRAQHSVGNPHFPRASVQAHLYTGRHRADEARRDKQAHRARSRKTVHLLPRGIANSVRAQLMRKAIQHSNWFIRSAHERKVRILRPARANRRQRSSPRSAPFQKRLDATIRGTPAKESPSSRFLFVHFPESDPRFGRC